MSAKKQITMDDLKKAYKGMDTQDLAKLQKLQQKTKKMGFGTGEESSQSKTKKAILYIILIIAIISLIYGGMCAMKEYQGSKAGTKVSYYYF